MAGDAAPLSLLLIEDDEGLRDAYRLVLTALGLTVDTAASAAEALSRVAEVAPRAIVADLGLPDLEGPSLIRRLHEAAPGAALVVLTGRDSDALRRSCGEAGADAFMVKPATGRDLERVLEGLLGSADGARGGDGSG